MLGGGPAFELIDGSRPTGNAMLCIGTFHAPAADLGRTEALPLTARSQWPPPWPPLPGCQSLLYSFIHIMDVMDGQRTDADNWGCCPAEPGAARPIQPVEGGGKKKNERDKQ